MPEIETPRSCLQSLLCYRHHENRMTNSEDVPRFQKAQIRDIHRYKILHLRRTFGMKRRWSELAHLPSWTLVFGNNARHATSVERELPTFPDNWLWHFNELVPSSFHSLSHLLRFLCRLSNQCNLPAHETFLITFSLSLNDFCLIRIASRVGKVIVSRFWTISRHSQTDKEYEKI